MKEPGKIPLTNNPKSKEPEKRKLASDHYYDIDTNYNNENYPENNSESISELESYETD
jgi:hypothetical protein